MQICAAKGIQSLQGSTALAVHLDARNRYNNESEAAALVCSAGELPVGVCCPGKFVVTLLLALNTWKS